MLAQDSSKLVQSSIDFPWDDSQVSTVEDSALGAMGKWALGMSFLWVELPSPGPEVRGQLGLFIEKAIEEALLLRGAVSPGIRATTGLDISLSDQLYRARLIEQRGLALGIPSLEGIANLGRTLDAEDSAVLRWWMAASADRPVRLVLAESNKSLRVYPSPVLFESLYDAAPQPVTPRPPSTTMAESAESMELSDLPPAVTSNVQPEEQSDTLAEEQTYSLFEAKVELPDLDFALGLTKAEPDAAAENLSARPLVSDEQERADQEIAAHDLGQPPVKKQLPLTYTPEAEETASVASAVSPAEIAAESNAARPAIISSQTKASQGPVALPTRSMSQSALDRLATLKAKVKPVAATEEKPASRAGASKNVQLEEQFDEFGRRPILSGQPSTSVELTEQLSKQVSGEQSAASETGNETIREQSSVGTAHAGQAVNVSLQEQREFKKDDLLSVSDENLASVVNEPLTEATVALTELSSDAERPQEPISEDAFDRLARTEWRVWARQLEAGRGPRPLSVVERHFVTEYTRLREAVRRGIADPSVTELLDAWSADFSKSYKDAFDALRVRGKRPTMVLDMPEAAARLGRLQGARRVQLVMVDSLRFDLGLMLQDQLRSQVDAALTERLLLWSALPTTTTYQLQLLAQGADGLKEPGVTDEAPALVARGRAALSPRRIRAGRLELFKVDTVADALAQPGLPIAERLPEIAASAAGVLAEHFKKQPPRTLVVVFGDHGFRLDPNAVGTEQEVKSGGASPEEVLVPAFAWLTGAVH